MVSAYLGGRKLGVTEIADAKKMPNRCASNPPMSDIAHAPMWNGWGVDPTIECALSAGKRGGLDRSASADAEAEMGFRLASS